MDQVLNNILVEMINKMYFNLVLQRVDGNIDESFFYLLFLMKCSLNCVCVYLNWINSWCNLTNFEIFFIKEAYL